MGCVDEFTQKSKLKEALLDSGKLEKLFGHLDPLRPSYDPVWRFCTTSVKQWKQPSHRYIKGN